MNIIDTRELHERMRELQDAHEEIEALERSEFDSDEEYEQEKERLEADFGEDEQRELKELEEMEDCITEFWHGETLIPEENFTEYAEELCTDTGYISRDFPSWIEIDWEATAENIMVDYIEVEYQGTTYLARSC